MNSVSVLRPGFFSTIQDLGRLGHAHEGVCPCGALDDISLRFGNRLVGNADQAAAIEMTLLGCDLEVNSKMIAAFTGAPMRLSLETPTGARAIPMWSAFECSEGSVIRAGSVLQGCRTYLCIAGQIDVEPVLDSRSTHVYSGIGGMEGRALRTGDTLRLGPPSSSSFANAISEDARHSIGNFLNRRVLRVTHGAHSVELGERAFSDLLAQTFTVSNHSDRRGVRLEGLPIHTAHAGIMQSEGVLPGSIQLPPGGLPIVLLADGPTTGGYPVIASVIAADLPALGQCRPGDQVRFEPVDLNSARAINRAQSQWLDGLLAPHRVE